jgi:hypothetical protein
VQWTVQTPYLIIALLAECQSGKWKGECDFLTPTRSSVRLELESANDFIKAPFQRARAKERIESAREPATSADARFRQTASAGPAPESEIGS